MKIDYQVFLRDTLACDRHSRKDGAKTKKMKTTRKLNETVHKTKYVLPFLVASILPDPVDAQSKYDGWEPPDPPFTEKINPFISPNSTPQALAYNAEKDSVRRAQLIANRTDQDWVYTIPTSFKWNCNQATKQFIANGTDFGKDTYYSNRLMFNGYAGFNTDSIIANGGSWITSGNLGLPVHALLLNDGTTLPAGHLMGGILSGKDITAVNKIEPQFKQVNVQPGQAYIPRNCEQVVLMYTFVGKVAGFEHDRNFYSIPIALYKIEDGVMKFVETNPFLKDVLITKRDTVPPTVTITHTSDPKTLQWRITDENFKKAWYTIDDGPQIPIDSTGMVNLTLTDQIRKITVTAEDWFRLKTEVTTYRNATDIDAVEYAPQITTYPNPFTDQITITNSGNMGQPVVLMDMMGRVLYRTVIQGENLTLTDPVLSELNPGTYILQVGEQKQKVVKVR